LSSDFDHVVGPDCGSEFQPHVTQCIDCGGATVPPDVAEAQARGREGALIDERMVTVGRRARIPGRGERPASKETES
jgi:hypothetical protein